MVSASTPSANEPVKDRILVHIKEIIMIISMNKSQESTVFGGRLKLTSAMKLRPRNVMVDFKFDDLYR